eukprot:959210-Prymnesium_polylepis.2
MCCEATGDRPRTCLSCRKRRVVNLDHIRGVKAAPPSVSAESHTSGSALLAYYATWDAPQPTEGERDLRKRDILPHNRVAAPRSAASVHGASDMKAIVL